MTPWDTKTVTTPEGLEVRITATPARHGPPVAHFIAGDVIGFVLEWEGQQHGALYFSGDTRLYKGIEDVARRFTIGTAVLNMGAGGFAVTGSICYSMPAGEAARAAEMLAARQIVPLHYDGWTHFREGKDDIVVAFEQAGLSERLIWLPRGVSQTLSV